MLLRSAVSSLIVLIGGVALVPSLLEGQTQPSEPRPDEYPVLLTTSLRHGLDTTVSPCVDFDKFVNGGWRTATTLPDSVTQITIFHDIYYRTQQLFATILDSARRTASTTSDADTRVLGYYFESCMVADSLPRALQQLSMHNARKQDTSRRSRCTRLAMHGLSDAMGQAFVRTILPPPVEQAARQMIDSIRADILTRVRRLPYLSSESKQRILASLEYMTLKIAKPETTIDHSELKLSATDLLANQRAVDQFVWKARMFQKDTIRRVEWKDRQYNPNAHYDGNSNSVEIPALLFQWPFFDAKTELALAYAGAGFIVGHEIIHGVAHRVGLEDLKALEERIKPLVVQYSSFPGVYVDGLRTLNENIADLGGLLASYDAWARTARASAAPTIEGFTPDQRFFLHYARLWRTKGRSPSGDTHSPGPVRINGTVMNVPAFATAFGCKQGDPMFKSLSERAEIW